MTVKSEEGHTAFSACPSCAASTRHTTRHCLPTRTLGRQPWRAQPGKCREGGMNSILRRPNQAPNPAPFASPRCIQASPGGLDSASCVPPLRHAARLPHPPPVQQRRRPDLAAKSRLEGGPETRRLPRRRQPAEEARSPACQRTVCQLPSGAQAVFRPSPSIARS